MCTIYLPLPIGFVFCLEPPLHAPSGTGAQEAMVEEQDIAQEINTLMHVTYDDLLRVQREA